MENDTLAGSSMFEDHLDIQWGRRLITTPIWYVTTVLVWLLMPIAMPLLFVWDLLRGERFSAMRTYLYFALFFGIESVGLLIAFGIWVYRFVARPDVFEYYQLNRRLQRWWARQLFWRCVQVFGVEVSIEGREILEENRDALVLSRHASTLDTMIPLAIVRQMRNYRYVIKAELLADPAMDYVAQRFPNCFVRRGGQYSDIEVERVVTLGETLEEGGAVVIYPEGTRYTSAKRARLLEKYADHDPDDLLPVVKRLEHTLPPLREGARKLVETMTDADVIFIAHRGIDQAGAMSDLIKGMMTGAKLEIRIWRVPAEEVPRDPDAIREFMVTNWELVDAFAGGEDVDGATHSGRDEGVGVKPGLGTGEACPRPDLG